MPSFREARDLLLAHRTDYAAAIAQFRWPEPAPFNWALDWFDAGLAAEFPDRPALRIVEAATGAEQSLTFSELSRRSNQVANHLKGLGLKRGDHLLLLLGNVPALWETFLAAMKLGVVVIPATTLLTAEELADRLERGRARAIVAGPEQLPRFAKLDTAEVIRIVTGSATEGWRACPVSWRRTVRPSCSSWKARTTRRSARTRASSSGTCKRWCGWPGRAEQRARMSDNPSRQSR